MTLLGKIFTVLILIMSVLFMGFSVVVYATHRNWKMLVDNPTPTEKFNKLGLKQQLEQKVAENESLKLERTKLKSSLAAEQAARRHVLGGLETKLAETERLLADKEKQRSDLDAIATESAAALKTAQITVDGLRKEVAGLRDEIRVAQADRDTQFEKVVTLTDQLQAARGVERNLMERQQNLLVDISNMKRVLDKFGLNPNESYDNVPPSLDGIVTAVNEANLIEVSLGSDDGLQIGHRVEVFRDNSYLGFAVVLKTNPDRAVAKVDEKSKQGMIKVQDRVATKLSRTRTG